MDVEFIQVLQDMIGDLSNAPEPIQIKMFSPDAALLSHWAPRVADAIGKVDGVVDLLNGIENTISGPARFSGLIRRSLRARASRQRKWPSMRPPSWRASLRPRPSSRKISPTPFACAIPRRTAVRWTT